jgi:hypothetical protein
MERFIDHVDAFAFASVLHCICSRNMGIVVSVYFADFNTRLYSMFTIQDEKNCDTVQRNSLLIKQIASFTKY